MAFALEGEDGKMPTDGTGACLHIWHVEEHMSVAMRCNGVLLVVQ